MNGKLTNARHVASGAHLFARYVRTCCENGSEGNGKRSPRDIEHLGDFVDRNDSTDEKPLQQLLRRAFPDPVKECFNSDGKWEGNPADFVWPIDWVQKHWRYTHTGPKSGDTAGRFENGCRTIRAKVLRKYPSVDRLYVVEVEGQEVFVIDLFDLNPGPEEFVYFHQRVICEVEEPTDYLRAVGLDGGENQFGRVEPPDPQETYELEVRGGEVIRPPELPTVPLASSGQPGEEPASGNPKFGYLFTIPLPSSQPTVRADGEVGEDHEVRVPGFTASPIDVDSVEVGNPTTVLPPTKAEHCDCGHECKGGHPCPCAPYYVQSRDPSLVVVSPGRVVGGQVLADKVVDGTETADVPSQLRLLVEEDYLPDSSPVEAGGEPKPVRDRPNPPAKPIQKIIMGGDFPSPYKS